MADVSDVETALAGVISAVLYPNGTAAASAIGATCRVYRGWPVGSALAADLAAGVVNVTVFPVSGATRNTTRWQQTWLTSPVAPTLTVTVLGETATFGGSADPGQLAGLLADNVPAAYRTGAGDTPALVAAALAAQIRAVRVVQVSGASVTIPGAASLIARSVADAPGLLAVRQQQQMIRITAWCPTPALRDQACVAIDAALAAARFIQLPDGSTGHHRMVSTASNDRGEDAATYRRDLVYAVDYPTTLAAQLPVMLFGDIVSEGVPTYS
ncbi:MAG TPA: hypothetical protein VHY76_07945 [Acetobacteraceae bacterium]|nr:hypothetical protein [Acetobacteraceae bacterium]